MNIIRKAAGKLIRTKQSLVRSYFKRQVRDSLSTKLRGCVLCRSNAFLLISDLDRYGIPLRLVKCNGCGLVMTNPAPTQEFLEKFYAGKAFRGLTSGDLGPSRRHLVKTERSARKNLEFLKWLEEKNVLKTKGATLLDYGCSDGAFLMHAKREIRALSAYGIEPGTRFSLIRCEQVDGMFPSLEEIPRSLDFSIVTMWHVLEHLHDPVSRLVEIRKKLVADGYLVLEVPDFDKREGLEKVHVGHLFHFDRRTLPAILEKAGFEVVMVTDEALQDPKGIKAVARKP